MFGQRTFRCMTAFVFTGERFFVFRDYKVCLTFFVVDCLGYSHVGAEIAALVCAFSHWECPCGGWFRL